MADRISGGVDRANSSTLTKTKRSKLNSSKEFKRTKAGPSPSYFRSVPTSNNSKTKAKNAVKLSTLKLKNSVYPTKNNILKELRQHSSGQESDFIESDDEVSTQVCPKTREVGLFKIASG